jgi:hypothetical protein
MWPRSGTTPVFHLGQFIDRDMIAVRMSHDQRAAIVGSPRYFESDARPNSPCDLSQLHWVDIFMDSAVVCRWEFEKGSKSLAVGVNGAPVIDDMDVTIRAAMNGEGWRSRPTSTWPRLSRVTHSSASSRIGALRSPASFSTTRAGSGSPRLCRR